MKRFLAIISACAMVLAMAGCTKDNDSSSVDSVASENSSTTESGSNVNSTPTNTASVLTADTDPATVVASTSVGGEEMNVTFGDFLKEYKYYLAGYGISEDTAPEYADTLTKQREYIVNYLINERIYERKAKELGIEFTEEELAQIQSDYVAGVVQMKDTLGAQIQSMLGEEQKLSEDELAAKADEAFEQLKTNCGLTDKDFYTWQYSVALREKLAQHANGDYAPDYSEAEASVAQAIETAKGLYEADPKTYNGGDYAGVWLPDGAVYVQHILIAFENTVSNEIYTLRQEGKEDEADAKRNESLSTIEERFNEVKAKVDAGEDFTELAKQYTDDADPTAYYLVTPDTGLYMEGFAECALSLEKVGDIAVCLTDYGYHIVRYYEEAVVTEDILKETTDGIYQYLIEAHKNTALSDLSGEWRTEYSFEINRDILLLGEETE